MTLRPAKGSCRFNTEAFPILSLGISLNNQGDSFMPPLSRVNTDIVNVKTDTHAEGERQPDLNMAYCNCLAQCKVVRAMSALHERYLDPIGWSSLQFGLLAAIHGRQGMGMQKLSTEPVMDRTSLACATRQLRVTDTSSGTQHREIRTSALALSVDSAKTLKPEDV